jgi:hypothetical protein
MNLIFVGLFFSLKAVALSSVSRHNRRPLIFRLPNR